MGLAASQARFLCITARKANCEYKSTELAQQKLEITNQLTNISNDYMNAMNATKLIWSNDAVDRDYGLTYSILMTPSPLNDYNPYLLTSKSGAIILNNEYAMAARAAGISMAGGVGTQTGRDKFIQALVPGGIVTKETANGMTINDYDASIDPATNAIVFSNATTVSPSAGVVWNAAAGMGAEPLNKSVVDDMTIAELIMSETIGLQLIDWAELLRNNPDQITDVEYNKHLAYLADLSRDVSVHKISDQVLSQLSNDRIDELKLAQGGSHPDHLTEEQINEKYDILDDITKRLLAGKYDANGYLLDDSDMPTTMTVDQAYQKLSDHLKQDVLDYQNNKNPDLTIEQRSTIDGHTYAVNTTYNTLNSKEFWKKQDSVNATGKADYTFSIVYNGTINHYKSELQSMTIGDILADDIVVMSNDKSAGSEKRFKEMVLNLFNSIVEVLGFSKVKDCSGIGLNIDDASAEALSYAYKMVYNKYFRKSDYAMDVGSRFSDKSMTDNSAYMNAADYNGFTTDDKGTGPKEGGYKAVSISNMISSFLTYFDQGLRGIDSPYAVGQTKDTSEYITDDHGYHYLVQDDPEAVISVINKSADFFDQLYNNICEYGWRFDPSIDDYEYLESTIKDGRYSLTSLNQDGYHYQQRYFETGYMIEESDMDAIARAEAEFTAKKAELTYKEDSIDLKTKQLDAEIATLSTELDTVKNLLSSSISKTFSLFQQ